MTNTEPPRRDEDLPSSLPQSSSLLVMLGVFLLVSVIALLTIVTRGGRGVPEAGGRRAYRPVDFKSEIDWEHSLHNEILAKALVDRSGEAAKAGGEDYFPVPPPPLSEDVFPCSECHEAGAAVELKPRELTDAHEDIHLHHGPKDRWCFDCHNPDDRDRLRLANGTLIGFEESYRLCGQCHGTQYRDWREGIHGRRVGYWNGPKTYLLCAHCHNPHSPRFQAMKPLPPPVRPSFLAATTD